MAGGVSRLLVVVWVFVVGFRFELDFGLVLGCWFSELCGLVVWVIMYRGCSDFRVLVVGWYLLL